MNIKWLIALFLYASLFCITLFFISSSLPRNSAEISPDSYAKCYFEYYSTDGTGFVIPLHNLTVPYRYKASLTGEITEAYLGKCNILRSLCIEKEALKWGGCRWYEGDQTCDCDVRFLNQTTPTALHI